MNDNLQKFHVILSSAPFLWGCQYHFQGRQVWGHFGACYNNSNLERAGDIMCMISSKNILFSEIIPHLVSTVANWHLDPGTQLWAGTSPQSSQSPHWVETLWWWWWLKDILGISITPGFSKASSNWQGKKLSGPRADYCRCAFEWM